MNKQSIALMVLWALSTIVLSVVLLQQRNELKRLENSSNDIMEAKYNKLDSIYNVGFTSLQDSITAINDTLEIARLRHSTQLNAVYYTLSVNQRQYEKLNDKLINVSNDSLLLLLTEQLSKVDSTQAR